MKNGPKRPVSESTGNQSETPIYGSESPDRVVGSTRYGAKAFATGDERKLSKSSKRYFKNVTEIVPRGRDSGNRTVRNRIFKQLLTDTHYYVQLHIR